MSSTIRVSKDSKGNFFTIVVLPYEDGTLIITGFPASEWLIKKFIELKGKDA